jgi:hypothetical protein
VKKVAQRLGIAGALLLLASIGIDELADATQTRPDQRNAERRTEVVVRVEGRNYRQSLQIGATALFASCSATVTGTLTEPGILQLGDRQFQFSLTPALGKHGRERLTGCLNDLTIERLRGNVVSIVDKPL